MKEKVISYLDKHYYFKFKTTKTASVFEFNLCIKKSNTKLTMADLMQELKTIFMLTNNEFFIIFDIWADKEYTRLNNIIVELTEKYFSSFGIEPTNEVLSELVEKIIY